MLSIQFFTISNNEGRWPNRTYFDVLPGSKLYSPGTKEEYIDWLYDAAQSNEDVAKEIMRIIDAVKDQQMVRVVVNDRFNDFRGNAVIELVNQVVNA